VGVCRYVGICGGGEGGRVGLGRGEKKRWKKGGGRGGEGREGWKEGGTTGGRHGRR